MISWVGRIALYVAFFAAVGGVTNQALALRSKKPSNSLKWSLLLLVGIAVAVGDMQTALILSLIHI